MNNQEVILVISDMLRDKLSANDLQQQVGLLICWKVVIERGEEAYPTLDDVLDDQASLSQAFKSLAAHKELGDYYRLSQLPVILSLSDIHDMLRVLKQIDTAEHLTLVDAFLSLEDRRSETGITMPEEMIDLMVELGAIQDKDVYTPFMGSLLLGLRSEETANSVAIEVTQQSIAVFVINEIVNCGIHFSDPLSHPTFTDGSKLRQFDTVLMAPPFGLKIKKRIPDPYKRFLEDETTGDVIVIKHALAQTKHRLITLTTQGVLFRGHMYDYLLRKQLLMEHCLEAVVQLPSNILPHTSQAPVLLVINKQREPNAPILFVNADQPDFYQEGGRGKSNRLTGWKQLLDIVNQRREGQHSRLVSLRELADNDFTFSVGRYIWGQGTSSMQSLENTQELSKVAEILRAQPLKSDEESTDSETYYEIGIRDISDSGVIQQPEKALSLSGKTLDRAELQRVYPGDILLSTKGFIGRVGIVSDNCGDNWVAGQAFQIIRVKDAHRLIAPEYLYMYLNSPLVQAYLDEQASGAAILVVSAKDIASLPIPVCSIEEQQQQVDAFHRIQKTYEQIEKLKQQAEAISTSFWPCK